MKKGLKIAIKSSHKRRAQRGAATYLQKTFPINSAPTNPRSAPMW